MKERNKTYMLNEMQPGERFYFSHDKKKRVYELSNGTPFETVIQKGFKIEYANCITANSIMERFIANRHR